MDGKIDKAFLQKRIKEIRGDLNTLADASIAIPVNAQGDLETVLAVLSDIAGYSGTHTVEIILAINNYPQGEAPPEIQEFQDMGIIVEATPDVSCPDEAVCFSARMTGLKPANTDYMILFDADCRIRNSTALIDWYIKQLQEGADLAYAHVAYYELLNDPSIQFRIFAHHGSRWFKRVILGIPTNRGSNYAVNRKQMLEFYNQRLLSDDLNVGPTMKAFKRKIVYSGASDLVVLTSGRMFTGGWGKLFRYLRYRLKYNMKMLPVGQDMTKRIERGEDNIRKVD
jgi:hypothetical protein